MRRRKRMMEELDQDIRDHIERDPGEYRARRAAGGSALCRFAQVRQHHQGQGRDPGGVEFHLA
jgi:hypothetical protein